MSAVAPFKDHAVRNDQNEHIKNSMIKAADAFTWLTRKGFTVLMITVEVSKPVLWVQNCPKVKTLKGAWYRKECSATGPVIDWQADLKGCRVQWTDKQ